MILGAFPSSFVGCVPVKRASGTDVCGAAVDRILALKIPRMKVDLIVTTTGVFMFDSKNGACVDEVSGVRWVSLTRWHG